MVNQRSELPRQQSVRGQFWRLFSGAHHHVADPPFCSSGYVGAAVVGGTMDGFITDNAFTRSIDTDMNGNICNKSDRLVAVMNLAAPFTVTSQTIAVNFNFILTNYGSQFVDGIDPDRIPEEFASAPFAGYFTVLNADWSGGEDKLNPMFQSSSWRQVTIMRSGALIV